MYKRCAQDDLDEISNQAKKQCLADLSNDSRQLMKRREAFDEERSYKKIKLNDIVPKDETKSPEEDAKYKEAYSKGIKEGWRLSKRYYVPNELNSLHVFYEEELVRQQAVYLNRFEEQRRLFVEAYLNYMNSSSSGLVIHPPYVH